MTTGSTFATLAKKTECKKNWDKNKRKNIHYLGAVLERLHFTLLLLLLLPDEQLQKVGDCSLPPVFLANIPETWFYRFWKDVCMVSNVLKHISSLAFSISYL